ARRAVAHGCAGRGTAGRAGIAGRALTRRPVPRRCERARGWNPRQAGRHPRALHWPREQTMRGYASSALLRAVRTGDADEVKRLLGPDVDTELKLTRLRRQSRGGESALWRAMMTLRLRDRTPPVRELVE